MTVPVCDAHKQPDSEFHDVLANGACLEWGMDDIEPED